MTDTHRWNFEETEDGFRVCRGDHHRSQDCEWEYFVPRPAVQPSVERIRTTYTCGCEVYDEPPPPYCAKHISIGILWWDRPKQRATPPAPAPQPEASDCPACKGSGGVREMTNHLGPDDYHYDTECPECGGTGIASTAGSAPLQLDVMALTIKEE